MKVLIQNELQKILTRKTLILSVVVLLVSSIAFGYITSNVVYDDVVDMDFDWSANYQNQIDTYNAQLNQYSMGQNDAETVITLKRAIERLEFELKHGISPSDWRNSLSSNYFEMKYAPYVDEAQRQAECEQIETLIMQDDWASYYYSEDKNTKEEQANYIEKSYGYHTLQLKQDINALRYQLNIKPTWNPVDWKNQLLMEYQSNFDTILQNKFYIDYIPANEIQNLENSNKIILYRLEHNISNYSRF